MAPPRRAGTAMPDCTPDDAPTLRGLSEHDALDALLAEVRRIALEDGAAARLARRGYGEFTVRVAVRGWRIVGNDVGSLASERMAAGGRRKGAD